MSDSIMVGLFLLLQPVVFVVFIFFVWSSIRVRVLEHMVNIENRINKIERNWSD